MQEATVLDGIGFTVPDSGESRLGRVPAQPARLRISRKSSAVPSREWLECEGGVISGLFSKP